MQQSNTMAAIGSRIKYYRTLHKISLSSLAKEANISKSTLFGLELGEANPTMSTLESIAKCLDIALSELIKESHHTQNENNLTPLYTNNKSKCLIYQLTLEPQELFYYNNENNQSNQIEILNGTLSILELNTTLSSNSKAILPHSCTIIAGNSRTDALIRVTDSNIPLYIKNDLFFDTLTEDRLDKLIHNNYSSTITRVHFKQCNHKIEEVKKAYITTTQERVDSITSYYIFNTFIGYKNSLKKLYEKFNEYTIGENYIQFIDKIIYNNYLKKRDFKTIIAHPIEALEQELITLLKKSYPEAKYIEIASLLTGNNKKGLYFTVVELLSQENSLNNLSATVAINLYRALECMVPLKVSELNQKELKLYNEIFKSLPKAFYYAYYKHTDLAIKIASNLYISANKIVEIDETLHKGLKILYASLVKQLEFTLKMYKENKVYIKKENLDLILKDNEATFHLAEKLHPSIDGSAKFIYLVEI